MQSFRFSLFGHFLALGIASLVAFSPLSLSAQSNPFRPGTDTISRLERSGQFKTLLTALELTGLKETVRTGGPFTLFAPTDAAFAKLPAGTLDALIADLPTLKSILLYHVASGSLFSRQLLHQSTATTLEGNPVLVTSSSTGTTVNQIRIVQANVPTSNGVIHVLNDGVLLPPAEKIEVKSVVDVLKLDGRFNILLAAAAGLDDELATLPGYTLFAPNDDAFAALPEGTVASLLANPAALANILTYHVLPTKKTLTDLFFKSTAATLQGQNVTIRYRNFAAFINNSKVINFDVRAPNGIIHVIDNVLLPATQPATLVDLLVADGRFTTLVAAVKAACLADTLVSPGPFTVLAPTDAAFAKLPPGTVTKLLADPAALKNILLYHVLAGDKPLDQLRRYPRATTVQGSTVHILRYFNQTYINRSRVIDNDLRAGNGVAHVIDTVLIPPAK